MLNPFWKTSRVNAGRPLKKELWVAEELAEAEEQKMQNKVELEHERISAMADGQLDRDEFERALDELDQAEDALSVWRTYHLVGEVLRSGEQALSQSGKAGFLAELDLRIQSEAGSANSSSETEIVPKTAPVRSASQINTQRINNQSANDPYGAWKQVAGFAFFAAVMIVTMGYLNRGPSDSTLVSLPKSAALTTASYSSSDDPTNALMLRDPWLDQLLSNHRQFGGTSALQMPTGFLRNATFETAAR